MSEHNYYQNNKSSHNSENDNEFLDESINDDDFDMVLLTLIKQYPYIYDPNKLNQEKINLAWNNISVEMNEKVEQCQDRYRRLRQYFSKERNRREFVAAGTKRDTKGWALYDCASFLNPFIMKTKPKLDILIAQTIQKIGSTLNTVAERLHETSTLPDNLFDTNYLVGRIVVAQLNKMSPKSANKKRKRIVKCLYSSDSDSN
ncbi:PREDICTED: uncharacterized protein LOC106741732 [Dinoponera quadriceps]|uniref:Uncharacterized protein LOC106741732 n=1 Tax=Dinoponera quadriceps TaxID=609295 RepID=A0A6P3WV09_DINQU|nr:PREDICTED: uncharacterized protein LOC106741732 [Dinoponera quadriceps]